MQLHISHLKAGLDKCGHLSFKPRKKLNVKIPIMWIKSKEKKARVYFAIKDKNSERWKKVQGNAFLLAIKNKEKIIYYLIDND